MSLFPLILNILEAFLTAGLGILAILAGTEIIPVSEAKWFIESAPGVAVLFLVGALLLVVSLHFILLVCRARAAAARFSQEGEWGRIELSPHALKEFISGILRQEIGIERFSVQLQHMEKGIAIFVKTALSPQEKVSEVGQNIQQTLARRVAERTGVEVREVSVLVESIRSRGEAHAKEEGSSDADAEP